MGEQKITYIVSLSGGCRTLVEHLVGGISTVTVGSDNAKSITSFSPDCRQYDVTDLTTVDPGVSSTSSHP